MQQAVAKILSEYQGSAPKQVVKAVAVAAERTGADFSYLMQKAQTESNFDPAAKAKTSSAKGLYQFIESTWMGMVKQHGHKYGLGAFAAHIETKNGQHCVHNCDVKKQILSLRNDPTLSALMAGEYSAANKGYLEKTTGQAAGATELYLAHFLGAGGAAKLLNARSENPQARAADLFPAAARANKNVFYDQQTKTPRSVEGVYAMFAKKFNPAYSGATQPSGAPTPDTISSSLAAPRPAVPSSEVIHSDTPPHGSHASERQAYFISDALRTAHIIWNDEEENVLQMNTQRLAFHTMMQVMETTRDLPASGFGARKDTYGYNA